MQRLTERDTEKTSTKQALFAKTGARGSGNQKGKRGRGGHTGTNYSKGSSSSGGVEMVHVEKVEGRHLTRGVSNATIVKDMDILQMNATENQIVTRQKWLKKRRRKRSC